MQHAQYPWEEISRRKQIPAVGEETEGKGSVEKEATLGTRHLRLNYF